MKRPDGTITSENLKLSKEEIPSPGDGQLLVKNLYMSIDPTHRIWMSDIPQYMPCVQLGEVMRAVTLGVVTESKNPDWKVGTHVVGMGGICDYYVGIPGVNVLNAVDDASTTNLSVASLLMGLTAWVGVNILEVKEGDVCVVSGAAGAVGSIAAQLCKVRGAKVVGIAGGPKKCAWLTSELGLDLAIDYKTQDIEKVLKEFAPDGVTGYFDNVGGSVTDAVLLTMKNFGKVAICGSISEYNDEWVGVKNFNMVLMRRLTVKGYICTDHMSEYPACLREIMELVKAGKIKYSEDIREGLENYIDVLNLLFTGGNTGKLIIKN